MQLKNLVLAVAAVVLFGVSASAQALQSTRCSATGNPAPKANYLSCFDIPVNANGVSTVSVFAVIEADGTVGSANGFVSNVSFAYADGTNSGPIPMSGSFAGSVLYPNSGSLSTTLSGGSISFDTVWLKPVHCLRYCNASLYQQNGVLTLN